MMILFALSLPGLVIVIIILGVIQLIRSKGSGERRPSSASAGIDLLDVVLKPGSEHRIAEQESKQIMRQDSERGAPPFSEFDVKGKRVTWKTLCAPEGIA